VRNVMGNREKKAQVVTAGVTAGKWAGRERRAGLA
jgi:hypothetical protein